MALASGPEVWWERLPSQARPVLGSVEAGLGPAASLIAGLCSLRSAEEVVPFLPTDSVLCPLPSPVVPSLSPLTALFSGVLCGEEGFGGPSASWPGLAVPSPRVPPLHGHVHGSSVAGHRRGPWAQELPGRLVSTAGEPGPAR